MCHPATVQSVGDDGTFQYQFDNKTLSMQATAGAPLLGDDGQLVGIHQRGQVEGDEVVGEGFGGEKLLEALNDLLATENVDFPTDARKGRAEMKCRIFQILTLRESRAEARREFSVSPSPAATASDPPASKRVLPDINLPLSPSWTAPLWISRFGVSHGSNRKQPRQTDC